MLKNYYFAKFATQEKLYEAVYGPPLQMGNEVLQVFPIIRDSAEGLIFSIEGTWRSKEYTKRDEAEKPKQARPDEDEEDDETQREATRRPRTTDADANVQMQIVG
jgi:hypothetical protein